MKESVTEVFKLWIEYEGVPKEDTRKTVEGLHSKVFEEVALE
jgi:hypothetical protein